MQNEYSKSSQRKANRILYIAIAGVLCICAAVAGIAVFTGNQMPERSSTLPVNQTPIGGDDQNTLPSFTAPLSGIVAKQHDLTTPVYSMTMQEYRVHRGVDITATVGASVYAAAEGVVKDVYKDPLMGWCVSLSHNGNSESIYCNLSHELAENIQVGKEVNANQLIGAVGETAILELADEPHLHFEMRVNGQVVNPLDYVTVSTGTPTEDSHRYEG